jgi:uncharacterized membrane protein YraQ (UPF0718 family)
MGLLFKNIKVIKNEDKCDCEDHDHHDHHNNKDNKLLSIINHTQTDFFEVVKYLMFGALLASLFQVIIPRNILMVFKDSNLLSILILMLFAYLVSLCSTSDSFVGKSLLNIFPQGSVLAYLILGPMIDIKNTIVLLGNYKSKFVVTLISLIFIIIFIFSLLVVNLL